MILFSDGDGRDRVTDFDVNADQIALSVSSVTGFADIGNVLKSNGQGHTVLDFGDGDALVLNGVNSADLTEDNFIFV